jgi:hypothetical protein
MIGQKGATTIIRSKDNKPSLGRALYEASRWLLYHNHG